MQNLPALVGARGAAWRVDRMDGAGRRRGTRLLHLSKAAARGAERLIAVRPHEPVAALAAREALVPASPRHAAAIIAAAAGASRVAFALHAAERLRGDIHPWQLCAALAFERGHARVLVADEAGMGKTVSAAIAIAQCLDEDGERRCLVVAPGHLVPQWNDELRERVALETRALDAGELRRVRDEIPAGVAPWALPGCAIASLDFFKQPHVLQPAATAAWDLLVVDEAHLACGVSERHAAVAMLARRARRVLLLTATPSDGGTERLHALLSLGSARGEPPLCLRHVAGRRPRVERSLRIGPSAAERALHAALARYTAWISGAKAPDRAAVHLLCSVLVKRALSSPHAAHVSLERRRALLIDADASPAPAQLPLFDGDGDDGVMGAASGQPIDRERAELTALVSLASDAAAADRRLEAVARLVRRAREPVVIFSCFRDTAARIAARLDRQTRVRLVHGEMAPAAMQASLDAFRDGRATVLVATDVASQGLNLQARCRWVIHYDLPWRPPLLGQRAGRVDRLGQTRRVHATTIDAQGTEAEAMRARLAWLADRMHAHEQLHERRWDALADIEARRLRAVRDGAGSAAVPPIRDDVTVVEIECVDTGSGVIERRAFALQAGEASARAWAGAWCAARIRALRRHLAIRCARRVARERDVLAWSLETVSPALRQDGLFERRVERERLRDARRHADLAAASRDAIGRHRTQSLITAARLRVIATITPHLPRFR